MKRLRILFEEHALLGREAKLLRLMLDLHVAAMYVAFSALYRDRTNRAELAQSGVEVACRGALGLIDEALPGLHPSIGASEEPPPILH